MFYMQWMDIMYPAGDSTIPLILIIFPPQSVIYGKCRTISHHGVPKSLNICTAKNKKQTTRTCKDRPSFSSNSGLSIICCIVSRVRSVRSCTASFVGSALSGYCGSPMGKSIRHFPAARHHIPPGILVSKHHGDDVAAAVYHRKKSPCVKISQFLMMMHQ